MIRWFVAATVVALIFSAATVALSFQQDGLSSIAIDVDTEGNSANSLGTQDSCRSVSVGDSFEVDLTIADVPPAATDGSGGGLSGFNYNLHYDPDVLNITGVDNAQMLESPSSFEEIQANFEEGVGPNPLPSTSGNMLVAYLNLVQEYADGDGVLSRLTIEAVGEGRSDLTVQDDQTDAPYPVLAQSNNEQLPIASVQYAVIAAGEPCEAQPEPTAFQPAVVTPRPTPGDDGGGDGSETETPTGSPGDGGTATPSASVVPVGDTELAIDAVTSGNSPTSIGEVDDCAAATEGEAFLLDVLISGVEDLLAWDLPVTFDPGILRIDDHDVELFQAANEGSQVFDTSNQTPNDTGTYFASAFDAADPQTPDSGEGVLVRLVMMPVGNGVSEVGLGPVDINEDGTLDRGILLRNVDGALIGDEDGDSLFDGPAASAEIRVGSDCEDGATVVPADAQTEDDDGGSDTWIWIVSGIVIVLVAAAGTVGIAVMRRRSSGPPTPPMTPTG